MPAAPHKADRYTNPKERSAYDRGSADRYYGRPFNPQYRRLGIGPGRFEIVPISMETPSPELAAYTAGWDEEEDRK